MQTGQKLAALRKRAGLTQEQLADALFVSRDLVSKWETGKRRPNEATLQKVAELFGVELSELQEKETELSEELAACIPEGFSSEAELTALLKRFMESLTVRDRSVFLRRYYFREDTAEIGAKYGISAAHVRTVLMRTRKKLKNYFKEAT